jgi:LysR family glycine cleavage system transcriptional activator
MPARLPPLNALRAFEAAGRNQSFTKAADELFVTPGAISRQIRALEDHLGFPLFQRNHREVRLTEQAAVYLEALTDVFNRMESATYRLIDARKQRLLHIHTAITFTLRWLVPRLSGFHGMHPKTEIRLSTTLPSAAELCAAPTDVIMHTKSEEWAAANAPVLISHRLVDIELVPVCSPQYKVRHGLGGSPAALANATLLHSSRRPNDWASWLEASKADSVDPMSGIRFESSSLAYQSAIEGIGVAIAMRAFVERDLEARLLVMPFTNVVRDGSAFYLTYSQAAANLPQVMEFRDWVTGEAASDNQTKALKAVVG